MAILHDVDNVTSLIEPVLIFSGTIAFTTYLLYRALILKSKPTKVVSSSGESKVPLSNKAAIFVGLAAYYFGSLYYNTGGLEDLIQGTDPKLEQILALSPSILRGPSPPWMLQNRHMQFVPWMIQNEFHRGGIPFERHEFNVSACLDKGEKDCVHDPSLNETISLDIFPPLDPSSEFSANFNSSSPVVLVAPGLRCFSQDLPSNMIIRRLWAEGFRTVAINRRGHTPDKRLEAPRWNLFGDVDDLEQVYWHVKNNLVAPNTALFLHGISSGCAVVVRALSVWDKRKETNPELPSPTFVGSITLTPGYDTSKVLKKERFKFPYNALMTAMVKDHFVQQNEAVLRELDSEAVDATLAAESLQDFLDAAAPFAGYKTADAYYEGENPVNELHYISTPVFVMNSVDDPCCAISNLYERSPYPQHNNMSYAELVSAGPRGLIAVTKTGSHCPFLDGTFFPWTRDPFNGYWMISSWADTAAVEFYKSALQVYDERRFL
ncbi:hypothetical protein TrRE_jg252 [Triparma retinervis]|uniref:AB hydrolase-1 domain-containing protein n=1 Tax=Triparma retinervis TaxID=2557542 RepID=A0A9W7E6Z2_9STRA|nr:hypothetical protein TrRE_jg252 [Triparma retinervis]